jgi:hypothetical protein
MNRRSANKDQERTIMTTRYVGVNQLEAEGQGRQTGPPNPTLSIPQSGSNYDTKRLLQAVTTLLAVRIIWAFSRLAALLAISILLGWGAYSLRQAHLERQAIVRQEAEQRERRRRNRLLEEEAEAMVRESAKMTLEIDQQHLQEFLAKHQNSGNAVSYERWIGELHPDNVLPDGGGIDHRFYVEDSDHRIMWNETMMGDDEVLKVKAMSLQQT